MAKETILVAIPAYGGDIKTECVNGIVRLLQDERVREKYNILILTAQNEALISRLRQEIAKEAITRQADRLFFLDADIGFTAEQFLAIVEADKQVVGGTYLKKTLSQPGYNFNLLPEQLRKFLQTYRIPPNTIEGFELLKQEYCQDNPLLEVAHVPTGFLCIKKEVLEKLSAAAPRYLSERRRNNEVQFSAEEVERMSVAEIFPVSVKEGILESEDWGFCRLCRENEIPVFLHTGVAVDHTGSIVFHKGLFGKKD